MLGIKRWADLRVRPSQAHKHSILQRWDRSGDCGHKQILWKYARAPYSSALARDRALTEFSHFCRRAPLRARPSRASHLERRPGQLLPPFHMHFAVKAETWRSRACGSAECKLRPLYQWVKTDKKWQAWIKSRILATTGSLLEIHLRLRELRQGSQRIYLFIPGVSVRLCIKCNIFSITEKGWSCAWNFIP